MHNYLLQVGCIVGLAMGLLSTYAHTQTAATRTFKTAQLEQKILQAQEQKWHDQLNNAFEYDDIIDALYRAHDFYAQSYREQIAKKKEEDLHNEMERRGIPRLKPDSTLRQKPLSLIPEGDAFLNKLTRHQVSEKDFLETLAPVNPAQNSWEQTSYAAAYVPTYLQDNAKKTKAFERFLRQLQMRILFRLSQADPVEQRKDSLQDQAVARLRVALMTTHIVYVNLFRHDPFVSFHPQLPYARFLDEVVVTAKRTTQVRPSRNTREQVSAYSLYEAQRQQFLREIAYWKSTMPTEPYTFTKTVEALKSRNKTANFSFAKASGDLAAEFLFLDFAKTVFTWLNPFDTEYPSITSLRALAPSAVEYDLLNEEFAHVPHIVAVLEAEKLGENKYGGVFKNSDLYQGMQPIITEVFNTLYIYAITPGRTPSEWTRTMDLLAQFANGKNYSIMTRLNALAIAAKLLDIRNQALNPNQSNKRTPEAKQQKLAHEKILPGTPVLQRPANYYDYMAGNVVDIYATLTAYGTLAGMQDYGLQAKQMKELADQLARLYNIFATGTSDAYPRILPANQANVEEVWAFNDRGLKVKQLHTFGARVQTSWGEMIEMNLSAPLNSKYKFEKDAGEFLSQFAVDVASWKFMVGGIRLGKRAIGATMRFINPVRSSQLITAQAAKAAQSAASSVKPLTLDAALKEGIGAQSAQAAEMKYMLEHPLPSVSEVKTYEDALRAIGLQAGATRTQIRSQVNKLSRIYSRDKVEAIASARGIAYAEDQAKSINNIREMLLKGKKSASVSRMNGAEQAAKTHADEVYEAAAQEAAKAPSKSDPHSWGNVTQGFAQFYGADYLFSYANEPLQKSMEFDYNKAAQANAYTYGDKQKPQQNAQEEHPLAFLDAVNQKATPKRLGSGAALLLPVNLIRKGFFFDVDFSTKDEKENFKGMLRANEFQHAFTAAEVNAFDKFINNEINILPAASKQFLSSNEAYLKDSPKQKEQIAQAYQTYNQLLKGIRSTAQTDLAKAKEQFKQANAKFINTQAQAMRQAIPVFIKNQLEATLQNSILTLALQYTFVATEEDYQQVKRVHTNFYRGYEQAMIDFYTANQRALETSQDPNVLKQKASDALAHLEKARELALQKISDRLDKQMEKDDELGQTINQIVTETLKEEEALFPENIEQYPQIKERLETEIQNFNLELNDVILDANDAEQLEQRYQQLRQERNARIQHILLDIPSAE